MRHETEEVAYVVAGAGRARLDEGAVGFRAGDALHIPAGVWHAVANTGDEDVVMVFGFPHPDYPPTERTLTADGASEPRAGRDRRGDPPTDVAHAAACSPPRAIQI